MLIDFVCTGQLVGELTKLRQAYAYAGTASLVSVLRDVDESFTTEGE